MFMTAAKKEARAISATPLIAQLSLLLIALAALLAMFVEYSLRIAGWMGAAGIFDSRGALWSAVSSIAWGIGAVHMYARGMEDNFLTVASVAQAAFFIGAMLFTLSLFHLAF
jgi:hypothetical protein